MTKQKQNEADINKLRAQYALITKCTEANSILCGIDEDLETCGYTTENGEREPYNTNFFDDPVQMREYICRFHGCVDGDLRDPEALRVYRSIFPAPKYG